ncbi:MAG TPA: tail fiber domain-containing protein, partial [Flavobacteriales bacterium]|nr:tail fiber domain-containing protein [Flavobacteriales bacterium]
TSTSGIHYNIARISAHREDANPTYSSLRFYTRKLAVITEAMRIDEDANVGIGTPSPDVKLDVVGAVKTSRLGTYGTYLSTQVQGIWSLSESYTIDELNDDFGTQYGMGYAYNLNGGSPFASEHQIVFTNNGTVNAAIGLGGSGYFGGDVKIGTTTGSEKVTIRGTGSTSATDAFLVENSAGTDIFNIRDDGRVAIGTAPSNSYNFTNYAPSGSTADYNLRNYFLRNNAETGTMYGLYNYTYRGSIAVSGVVYGVYSPAYNYVGTGATYGVRGYATGTSTGGKNGIYGSTAGSGTRYAGYFSGDVYCTGAYMPSDESLKRNISDYDNALDQLSSIEVKEYEYKHEGDMSKMDLPKGRQVGIMAQNIENVFPQLTKDSEFDLNDDPENDDPNREENIFKFKAVNYTGLVPVLVKAVQEQQEQIASLQSALESQQQVIAALQEK